MVAGFSFQGTEMIGVAAGESENPRRDVPRALTSVFWRIMLFYIGAMVVIGFLIPYSDPNLLTAADGNINISPVHPHLRACGHRLRGSHHERRDPLRSAFCR